jgi:hypothetical protein
MRPSTRWLPAFVLAAGAASAAPAAPPELGLTMGRATESNETDILRRA